MRNGGVDSASEWSVAGRRDYRAEVLTETPGWYSPLLHFAFPAVVGLGVIVGCALALHHVTVLEWLTIPFTLVLSNAIEWHAHRDLLHKKNGMAPILYERHTPVHHRLFSEDDMAITDWRELRNVMLPAFGVLAILSLQVPLLGVALLLGYKNVALLFLATSMSYVLLYEWLHLAYHLPPTSFVGSRTTIRWLRRHHAHHHDHRLMQRWNMNVTLPLWDWLRGTIHRSTETRAAPLRSRGPSRAPALPSRG